MSLKPVHEEERQALPHHTSPSKTASIAARPPPAMTGKRAAESPTPPVPSKRIVVPALLQDRLGTLVKTLCQKLACASSWREFVNGVRGKSYLAASIDNIPHTARNYLQQLRDHGTQVRLDDPPWDTTKISLSAERGAHPSALVHRQFLRGEFADFIEAGFWVVLPLKQLLALPDADLRLSPMAVKDEFNRRPRVIIDHTWFGVNEHTIAELPKEVMQFGGTLPRLLWILRHANPAKGQVYLSKFDIDNGFYRMFLDADDALKLAAIMPRYDGEEQLIAVPLAQTMGWTNSPPTFCAASETAADLANANLYRRTVPPHRLEHLASAHDVWEPPPPGRPMSPPEETCPGATALARDKQGPMSPSETCLGATALARDKQGPMSPSETSQDDTATVRDSPGPTSRGRPKSPAETTTDQGPLSTGRPMSPPESNLPTPRPTPDDVRQPLIKFDGPVAHVDVFVDDFIGIAQGSRRRCLNTRRCIMHAIDDVFARPDEHHPDRKEAISEKKLNKGDGGWNHRKEVLGWILDTSEGTLELTDRRKARIETIFEDLRGKRRVSIKKWQRVLGELRFMGPAIPGSAGLFGAMQLGLKRADEHRVRITPYLRDHLEDFERLARSLATRPTRFAEIVPDYPSVIGAVDAAKVGMGGVLFAEDQAPVLWRAPFPEDIQQRIVSFDNPHGDITNSDLEQAGVLAQADVANTTFDLRERTLATLNDNTAAISRNKKGTISSDQAAAYLCRLDSTHRRHHRYFHETAHIKGTANTMADTISRSMHMSDDELLTLFNAKFPQEKPWRMCPLPTAMHSALSSCLRRKRPDVASCLQHSPTEPVSSRLGWLSARTWDTNPSSATCPPTSTSTSSSSLLAATAAASSREARCPSDLNAWRRPYAPSDRSSPDWASKIQGWTGLGTPFGSEPSSKPGPTTTQLQPESGRSTSPSSAPSPPLFSHTRTVPERRPSLTSPPSDSTSSAGQGSTPYPQPPTEAAANLSAFGIPPSAVPPSNELLPPNALRMTCRWGLTSVSPTPTRRMQPAAKPLATAALATTLSAQSTRRNAESSTYATTRRRQTARCTATTMLEARPTTSPPATSPLPSEPPPPPSNTSRTSLPTGSSPTAYAPAEPPLSSSPEWTRPPSVPWAAGNPMPFSCTFGPKPATSPQTTPETCSTTANTPSLQLPTSMTTKTSSPSKHLRTWPTLSTPPTSNSLKQQNTRLKIWEQNMRLKICDPTPTGAIGPTGALWPAAATRPAGAVCLPDTHPTSGYASPTLSSFTFGHNMGLTAVGRTRLPSKEPFPPHTEIHRTRVIRAPVRGLDLVQTALRGSGKLVWGKKLSGL